MSGVASPSKRDRPARGSGISGGGGATPFFGRQSELEQFEAELRDPRGSAILVVGHRGMGKTMLLHRFIALAGKIDGLQCGAVREEVTPSDTVETVLGIFMDRAYEAASITEGSGEPTPRRLEQWRALLNVVKIGDLVMSLRRDPKRNTREQFLGALERIAAKLPPDGRAVFIIDPEKYLPPDCDQDWAIVIRRLPKRIKLVFAQRPDDALADSPVISGLQNIARVPIGTLEVLDERGFDDLVDNRAVEIGMTSGQLKEVLAPYGRHPYAVVAAVDLLATGVSPDQLPSEPKPTDFAAAQWKQIKRGGQSGTNGELAIRLFQAYALLEVPVPDDLVEEVSGLSRAQRLSVTADSFLGPLLRDEAGLRRIYHAILSDHILSVIPDSETIALHEKAISAYRKRLSAIPPDGLSTRRLAPHVRAVDGDDAFVMCFIDECTPKLMQLGLLDEIEALTAQALATVQPESEAQAALTGNIGLVMEIRGDLDGAEAMYRKVIEIDEKFGRLGGMASTYGNLGNVMKTRGDLDGAEAMHRKALEIDEKLGRLEGMASDYGNLGTIMQTRGDLDGAEAMYHKALAIDGKLGRLEGMANQYGNLGTVMQTRSDLDGAEEMHQKALEINEKLGRLEGMANAYGNLGIVLVTRRDLDGAEEMHQKALEINEKLGRLEGIATQYGNLGIVMETRGDLDGAEAMYRKSLEIDEKLGRIEYMANQYSNLGNVMKTRGELDEAEAMYRKSLEINEKLGRIEYMANQYSNLGIVMRTRGDLDGAEAMFRKSLEIDEKLGRLERIASIYGNLGIIMQTRVDLKGAEAMYGKALEISEKLGWTEGMARAYGNLGIVLRMQGDLDGVQEMWTKSRNLFAEFGARRMVARIQGWIDQVGDESTNISPPAEEDP